MSDQLSPAARIKRLSAETPAEKAQRLQPRVTLAPYGYLVQGRKRDYRVTDDLKCECEAGQNGVKCYHVARVEFVLELAKDLDGNTEIAVATDGPLPLNGVLIKSAGEKKKVERYGGIAI